MAYWIAKLLNGQIITEKTHPWPPNGEGIISLAFMMESNGTEIKLPDGMPQYVQAKSACADLGSHQTTVLSRYIGFIIGNKVVRIRINESTGDISVELGES